MSGLDSPGSCLNPPLSTLEMLQVCVPIKFLAQSSCSFYGFTMGLYTVGASVNQALISLGKLSLFKKIEWKRKSQH